MKCSPTSQLDEVLQRGAEILLVDFGGVLCHYEPTPASEALAAPHLPASSSVTKWLFDHPVSWEGILGRLSADEVLSRIAGQAGLSVAAVEEIWAAFIAANVVDFSLLDELQRYRDRTRIFILSNYWSNGREVIFSKLPENSVDGLFVSSELGMKKPEPAIWRHLTGWFSRPPGAFALLDDEEPNVLSARAAGLDGYLWVKR